MIFFLNIFYKRKSYPYSRSNYYKRRLDESKSIQPYLKLISDLDYINEVETDLEIQLIENKKDNEINKKDIIRKYGRPDYNFICKDLIKIEILFYRQKLGSHKTKMEFHFFKNKLFLYTYKFSYLTTEERYEIIEIINEKYLEKQSVNIINNYIVDKNQSILMLDDTVEFTIKYLDKNNIAFKTILKQDRFQKSKVERDRITDKDMLYELL